MARAEVPAFAPAEPVVVQRVDAIARELPEVVALDSGIGRLWRVRKRNFAHVWGEDEPSGTVTTMQFRVSPVDLEALIGSGHPFFPAAKVNHTIRMFLTPDSDWGLVAELVTDSYCLQAPKTLARLVDRLPTPSD